MLLHQGRFTLELCSQVHGKVQQIAVLFISRCNLAVTGVSKTLLLCFLQCSIGKVHVGCVVSVAKEYRLKNDGACSLCCLRQRCHGRF